MRESMNDDPAGSDRREHGKDGTFHALACLMAGSPNRTAAVSRPRILSEQPHLAMGMWRAGLRISRFLAALPFALPCRPYAFGRCVWARRLFYCTLGANPLYRYRFATVAADH